METSDKIVFVMKWLIVAVVGVFGYQWYTGDMRIQNYVMGHLEKSGAKAKILDASRKTASTFNKVVGDDLKKGNPKAAIGRVQEQLKNINEGQKKKEQNLMDIENR